MALGRLLSAVDQRQRAGIAEMEGHRRILAELLHVAQHLRCGGIARLDVAVHRVHRDLLQTERDAGHQLAGQTRAAVDMLDRDGDRRLAVIGRTPGQHLIHHDAERINVAAIVDHRALGLLRRDIMHRAERLARERVLRCADPGDAEVRDLDAAVLEDQNVVRLDVAMDDAASVRVLKRLGDLHRKMQRLAPIERPLALHILLEGNALDQFHDDVIHTAGAGDVVHADDVGMRKHRNGLRFRLEPTAELLIARKLLLEDLDRDKAVQAVIQRLIDLRHATGADVFENLIPVVQQSSDVAIHRKLLSANAARFQRRTGAEICQNYSSIKTEVTLSGAPRFFAISSSRRQQSSRRAPWTTSNRIS